MALQPKILKKPKVRNQNLTLVTVHNTETQIDEELEDSIEEEEKTQSTKIPKQRIAFLSPDATSLKSRRQNEDLIVVMKSMDTNKCSSPVFYFSPINTVTPDIYTPHNEIAYYEKVLEKERKSLKNTNIRFN